MVTISASCTPTHVTPASIRESPAFVAATNGFLVGGLTSGSDSFPQIADGVTEAPFSGVLFSGDIGVVSGLTQGCSPVGPMRRITKCRGNVAITIDDRPALDVLKEDIGEWLRWRLVLKKARG